MSEADLCQCYGDPNRPGLGVEMNNSGIMVCTKCKKPLSGTWAPDRGRHESALLERDRCFKIARKESNRVWDMAQAAEKEGDRKRACALMDIRCCLENVVWNIDQSRASVELHKEWEREKSEKMA